MSNCSCEKQDGYANCCKLKIALARAEKAEASLEGANENWDDMNDICTALSALVVALRVALRCSGSGDLCKLRPEHKCNACKTLELPVPELAAAVQGAIEGLKFYAGARDSTWEGNRFLSFDKFGGICPETCGPYVATQALSRLDAAMGKKP